ncbi:leucine-rich repeat domain-containing protein [Spirosoma utsteinense]|uniref:Leucine-rich repeat domain-containing protein n=1 Tax=Spirosoma utsteinense TaxID=2585773 RepID=A0ABR6WCG9_9BACT|nr:leucine-rich repeat domain-containing protein [Spirosoma utsteinense]MBC3788353.1 hypothetical protein [Spirosoma utsteinense]MBC3794270.1 hypothetical protein [Spirosoma utsteinense]
MNSDITAPARTCPPGADTHAKRLTWWSELEPQWRAAFQAASFGHTNQPSYEDLEALWQTTVLRFAGPRAFHPNLPFELSNCSGLAGMSNLEILVLTNHHLDSIAEVAGMPNLKSLFVNNNAIQSLEALSGLTQLTQLYAQINQITSIEPLRNLTGLTEVYINFNALKTLNGLTRKHANILKSFYCLPNDQLPDRETLRVERTLGIRCRSLH